MGNFGNWKIEQGVLWVVVRLAKWLARHNRRYVLLADVASDAESALTTTEETIYTF